MAERSLTTPEIRGSNPNISIVFRMYLSGNCYSEKTKKEKKEARIGPFKKTIELVREKNRGNEGERKRD